jgi:DNA polymerase-3 subunit epsilon
MIIKILDTETTGLSPKEGKLIEVAFAVFDTSLNDVISAKSFLVNDNVSEDEVNKTKHIHGISYEMVKSYGFDLDTMLLNIFNMYAPVDAYLAHNADFDKQWFNDDAIQNAKWICSCDDIQWPKSTDSKSLISVALAHGVGVVSAHRALDDVMTLAKLLKRVGETHSLDEIFEKASRPKAKYEALVSFSQKDLAKSAGFRWDGERKSWWRKMAIEDVAALPFKTREIK